MIDDVKEFGNIAGTLSRNPLGIIALFIVLVYGLAALVAAFSSSWTPAERTPLIYFLVSFPVLVLGVFAWLVINHSINLFAPSDFKDENNYVKMQLTVAASLAAASAKNTQGSEEPDVKRIVHIAQEVDAHNKTSQSALAKRVLWVDDRPENNVYERQAFEAVGIEFVLSLNTTDALEQLSRQKFAAIISDMGRREGPREGYVLLDEIRKHNDKTPFFIFAGSNAPEHKREALEHGGQGSTNNSNELFQMVTHAVISGGQ
jgi:CheY-like chemotaxis protein